MESNQTNLFCNELVETASAVYLTTIDAHGFPQTRAMLNLRNTKQYPGLANLFDSHRHDLLIYFTTNTSSPKVAQMKANSAVCAYYCRPEEWRGLMLQGVIEVVTDLEIKKALWQNDWKMYYPGGSGDPDYAVLRLKPSTGSGYHQLQTFSLDFKESS